MEYLECGGACKACLESRNTLEPDRGVKEFVTVVVAFRPLVLIFCQVGFRKNRLTEGLHHPSCRLRLTSLEKLHTKEGETRRPYWFRILPSSTREGKTDLEFFLVLQVHFLVYKFNYLIMKKANQGPSTRLWPTDIGHSKGLINMWELINLLHPRVPYLFVSQKATGTGYWYEYYHKQGDALKELAGTLIRLKRPISLRVSKNLTDTREEFISVPDVLLLSFAVMSCLDVKDVVISRRRYF